MIDTENFKYFNLSECSKRNGVALLYSRHNFANTKWKWINDYCMHTLETWPINCWSVCSHSTHTVTVKSLVRCQLKQCLRSLPLTDVLLSHYSFRAHSQMFYVISYTWWLPPHFYCFWDFLSHTRNIHVCAASGGLLLRKTFCGALRLSSIVLTLVCIHITKTKLSSVRKKDFHFR